MADDLKVVVDFTGKGSQQLKTDFKNIEMSSRDLERELKALAVDYGHLQGKMVVLKKAGLENTAEFKQLEGAANGLGSKINVLGTQYQGTSEKMSLFRNKAVNLGADLTILSFGVKSVVEDIGAFAKETQSATPSITKMGASIGTATLSLLAMIPALKAIQTAIPAAFASGASVVGIFGIALFDAINKVDTLYKSFINLTQGGQGFFESLANALSSNIIGQLTQQIFGLNQAVEQSLDFMLASEKQREEMLVRQEHQKLGIDPKITQFGLDLDKQEEADRKDKENRQQQYSQSLAMLNVEKKTHGVRTSSSKELATQLNILQEYQKRVADLNLKIAEIKELQNTDNLLMHEKLFLADELNKKQAELNELMKIANNLAIVNAKVGNSGLFNLAGRTNQGMNATGGEGGTASQGLSEIDEALRKQMETQNAILGYTNTMWTNFQGMLESTGLMQGAFGDIINMINNFINAGKSAMGLVDAIGGLLSFIPSGGLIGGAIGAVAGGASGMSSGLPQIGNGSGGMMNNVTVVLNKPITFRKAFEISTNDRNTRLAIVNG